MKLNFSGMTGAAVLVVAVLAGAAGGAVALSATQGDAAPATPSVTLHQVADEGPTSSPTSTPVPTPTPTGIPDMAGPASAGAVVVDRSERSSGAAQPEEDTADRPKKAATEEPEATPAAVTHDCKSPTVWDEHGDNGQPGCVGLDCPTHQVLKRTADGRPFCAYPEPAEGAKCGPGYGYGPGAFSDGKGGMVECVDGTWVKYVAPKKPTPTPVPTPQNCPFAEDAKCEGWTPDGDGTVVIG